MAEQAIPEVKEEVKLNEYSSLNEAMGIKKDAPAVETPAAQAEPKETAVRAATLPAEKEKINIDDLTDDEVNALIEKRTGGKVKSLAELNKPEPKTAAELELEKEQKKSDALSWGIENKKLTRDQYDAAIIGKSKTDREIALNLFTAEMQADDKDITLEEAEEMFNDAYHQDDPESKLYKVGQKEIAKLANNYRKENFGILDTVEADYDTFSQTQDQYKGYRNTVKEVAAELPTEMEIRQPYKYLDGKEEDIVYKIALDEKAVNKLIADASSEDSFLAENFFSNGKMDKKLLLKKLTHNLKAIAYDTVVAELLKQNTKEVETRMEVVLGNKRNGAPPLNNGAQNIKSAPIKQNTYSSLEAAMKRN